MAKFSSRRTLPSSWSSTLSIEEGGLLSLHALGDFAKRVIWGWWQTALCSRTGTLGWSLNRWVLWEIISTFRSPLVPLSYFTLSTSRYHRCRVLSEWRSATLMHLSLLDCDHFGKTGNQMEEHFGNRYYLDYFVHFQRPIQLNFRSPSRTLLNHTFRFQVGFSRL